MDKRRGPSYRKMDLAKVAAGRRFLPPLRRRQTDQDQQQTDPHQHTDAHIGPPTKSLGGSGRSYPQSMPVGGKVCRANMRIVLISIDKSQKMWYTTVMIRARIGHYRTKEHPP